jgi:hypothetical protein
MIETLAAFPWKWTTPPNDGTAIPIVSPHAITLVISRSGETADTVAAQREAKVRGSKTSIWPRLAEQLTALYLFALYLAQVHSVMTTIDRRGSPRWACSNSPTFLQSSDTV